MTAVTKLRMSADEFIAWALEQPKRYELVRGEVVPMSPERAAHTRTKHLVWRALADAAAASGIECEVFGDGMSIRIDDYTIYEPDTLVRLGKPVGGDTVEINDPVIVVEVVSPSSRAVDSGAKLTGYFRLPSTRHYLIVDANVRSVIHHRRMQGGRIETDIRQGGLLQLDPPGMTVEIEGFFDG